jgi:hypothetical protein
MYYSGFLKFIHVDFFIYIWSFILLKNKKNITYFIIIYFINKKFQAQLIILHVWINILNKMNDQT